MKKKFLVQIKSNAAGKHCDLYPAQAVFNVKMTENGFQILDRKGSWIPPLFTTVMLAPETPLKACPYCKTNYTKDTPFISSHQNGDKLMCVTCFERRHITGDKYAYKQALREQIIKELNQ